MPLLANERTRYRGMVRPAGVGARRWAMTG